MNRRSFLKSSTATAALLSSPAALFAKKELSEAEIVAAAREHIPKIRTGKLSVRVRDDKGRLLPSALVKVQQTKHQFFFGATSALVSGAGGELEKQYIRRFTDLLNFATLQFYWESYESERGKPAYAHTDYVVEWARQNNITCKGHPLVWQHPASVPQWLPNDFKEIERLSKQRVHDLVSRYAGKIDYWDVVNEAHYMLNKPGKHPTLMEQFARSVGIHNYLVEHLQMAREANPNAKLIINDNKPDQQYFDMLQPLCRQRQMDVIGMQSHMHDGVWPMQKVWNFCEQFSKLRRPIHFTETTVLSGKKLGKEKFEQTTPEGEAAQADYVANFYTVLFGHPSVEAITWWDFSDLSAWLNAPSGLLRADMSPKPAYERLHSLIKGEWWTKAESGNGRCDIRAFAGTHEVSASTPDGKQTSATVTLNRGEHAHCELTLPA